MIINELLDNKERIVIYGAGANDVFFCNVLLKAGIYPKFFLISDGVKKCNEGSINGITIYHFSEWYRSLFGRNDIVYVAVDARYRNEIKGVIDKTEVSYCTISHENILEINRLLNKKSPLAQCCS